MIKNRGVKITVGNQSLHTFDNLNLYMLPPKISHPVRKTKEIDIPGADGNIDLMQFILDYPVFKNRTIDIEFRIYNRVIYHEKIVSKVSNFANGRYVKIIFDECPAYYFVGECTVGALTHNEGYGNFTISINAKPYKLAVQTVDEDYLWDSFDLASGIIYSKVLCQYVDGEIADEISNPSSLCDIPITDNQIEVNVLNMPVSPIITVKGDNCILVYGNSSYTLIGSPAGNANSPDVKLLKGRNVLRIKLASGSSNASVTLSYRDGVF